MDVAITRISSKGQVVIPSEMRKNVNEGDKLLIIQNNGQWIMKKANKLDENLKSDLDFAKRTEDAWNDYKKGKFKSMDSDKFIEEMEKW